jgi:uncharacterized protein YegP (UPF0339 family)
MFRGAVYEAKQGVAAAIQAIRAAAQTLQSE